MCREAAEALGVRQNRGALVAEHVTLIYTDQCVKHIRVLHRILLCSELILCGSALEELCEDLRTEGEGQNRAADR